MRKTRFKKFSAGIYHTILKKAKSTFVPGFFICQTNSTKTFYSQGLPLSNAQIRSKAPSSTKSWRTTVWVGVGKKISYCTLGRPYQIETLHSKIGRRVDFARDKKPRCSLSLCVLSLVLPAGLSRIHGLEIVLFKTVRFENHVHQCFKL